MIRWLLWTPIILVEWLVIGGLLLILVSVAFESPVLLKWVAIAWLAMISMWSLSEPECSSTRALMGLLALMLLSVLY